MRWAFLTNWANAYVGNSLGSVRPLADCGMVCLMPRGHALARQKQVSVAALCAHPLVLLGRETTWRSDLQALFRGAPRLPQVKVDTHSASAVCSFVVNGLGVSVLPELLAAQFTGRGLVLRPFEAPLRHRYVIGAPSGMLRSGLVEAFAREARAVAETLMHEFTDATTAPRRSP